MGRGATGTSEAISGHVVAAMAAAAAEEEEEEDGYVLKAETITSPFLPARSPLK